jgi:hypothetical protein
MRALYAAACLACLALAVAVMVNVAFFTAPVEPAPPATGTTTTGPAVAPAPAGATTAVPAGARGAAGPTATPRDGQAIPHQP